MARALVVCGTNAWRAWLDPFLEDPRYEVQVLEAAGAPDLPLAAVRAARCDAVVFLSCHETLRRDLCFVEPLHAMGVETVVCQPARVVGLGMDKRAVAARAKEIRGLRGILELTPKEARRHLESGAARTVVAKRHDGTEGQGMVLFRRPKDLTTTGTRLYEGGYLLQPFLAGEEYSVNMAWHGGACNVYAPVAKGLASEEGVHPIERTRACPAPLDAELAERCVAYMRPFAPSGFVEMEFIRYGGEFYVLDVNPRVSATLRMTAVTAASNPFADLLAAACGVGTLGQTVAAIKHAMEWPNTGPLPARLPPDVWVSKRVTVAAPDQETLARRVAKLRP